MIQQTSLPLPSLLLWLEIQRSTYLREQWRSTGKAFVKWATLGGHGHVERIVTEECSLKNHLNWSKIPTSVTSVRR